MTDLNLNTQTHTCPLSFFLLYFFFCYSRSKAVLPFALFHCQLQEMVVTDGWFPWVVSEVVLDGPTRENRKKHIDCETGRKEVRHSNSYQ